MPKKNDTADTGALTDADGNEIKFKQVGLDRHDKGSILLPKAMELHEGIYWLTQKLKDESKVVSLRERIEGYPIDVAYALGEACKEMFGFREVKGEMGWFGEEPPEFISVPIDHTGATQTVFLGRFKIPGSDGVYGTQRDFNDALIIAGRMKQKDTPVFNKLIAMTKKMLTERSLYKGKAFRCTMETQRQGFDQKVTMANPQFIDVTKLPAKLVLNQFTSELINAAVWTPIRQSERTRSYGVSLRRGFLLHGKFGTGKTLTIMETAKLAVENGWTFIYVQDINDLKELYRFAARYSPAILAGEDIDRIANDEAGVKMLDNVLDGLDTKNAEVITMLTTNYIDRIPQSLLRPGRFHTVIPYELPDAVAAAELLEQFAGNDIDRNNYDPRRVGMALEGNIPATIVEVANRAKLFSIARTDPDFRGALKLTTADLELSAKTMKEHMALLNRKPRKNPTLVEQFASALAVTGVYAMKNAMDHAKRGDQPDLEDYYPSIQEMTEELQAREPADEETEVAR